MGKEILVNYKEDGKRLLDELSKSEPNFKITTAMWYYLAEPDTWRLMIASPYVQKKGRLKSYKLIRLIMDKIDKESEGKLSFSLDNISVLKPDDPLINLIKIVIRPSKDVVFMDNSINGFFIKSAYIYFID